MSRNKQSDELKYIPCNGGSVYEGADREDALNDVPDTMEVLLIPLEDEVVFPYIQMASRITHPDSVMTAHKAFKEKLPVFFFLASESMPDDTRNMFTASTPIFIAPRPWLHSNFLKRNVILGISRFF